MSRKTQVCCQIDEKDVKKMEKIRDETGVPVSRQIEMKLKGYKIIKEDTKTAVQLSKRTVECLKNHINSLEEALDIVSELTKGD